MELDTPGANWNWMKLVENVASSSHATATLEQASETPHHTHLMATNQSGDEQPGWDWMSFPVKSIYSLALVLRSEN